MYNKTSVNILVADIYNDTYTKTETDSTLSGYTNPIDLHNGFYSKARVSITLDTYYNITETQANHYDKVATDSLFSNLDLSNYDSKTEVDDIDNGLSTLISNTYTKTEIDTPLYTHYPSLTFTVDNFDSKTEIDPTLSDYITSTQLDASYYTKSEIDATCNVYPPSAQILNLFYSKLYIDNTFISSTQTGALYYNKTETYNMLLSYSTGPYVDYNFYIITETDNFSADKLINTGDISSPGWLDIGTSGYTNSRIRCNAEVSGYTGYAEMRAATSYDMSLDLPTTRTDGGWMSFKTNNDDYMQLSSSDSKINIYKNTAIHNKWKFGCW